MMLVRDYILGRRGVYIYVYIYYSELNGKKKDIQMHFCLEMVQRLKEIWIICSEMDLKSDG